MNRLTRILLIALPGILIGSVVASAQTHNFWPTVAIALIAIVVLGVWGLSAARKRRRP
jgi:hypothetical protein